MTTTCTLTWAARASIVAVIKSRYPNEDADVAWSRGPHAAMPEHPEYTIEQVMHWKFDGDFPKRTDACALEAYLRHQAEHLDGNLKVEHDGLWPAMDEVRV